MTTETEGQTASGAEPRAQQTQTTETQPPKAPRNDAEAAQQDAAQKEADAKAKEAEAAKEAEQKTPKRNRTGEYINRLQTQNQELRDALKSLQEKQPQRAPEPTLEQSNFDAAAHTKATAEWAAQQAVDQYKFQQQQEIAQRLIQEVTSGYNTKVAEFSQAHPDFAQKVMAIPKYLEPSEAVQLAIMTHENGPEIAYALANDDDLAFQLASIQPHLAAAAVDRIASRLAAAQEAPQPTPPPAAIPNARPVSKAPPPVPTVSGKSPTETPVEKLTDQQWWERRHKRAS